MAKNKNTNENASEEKYRIKWSKIAKTDLNEIHDFIALQNPRTAITIIRKIKAKADTLDHFPFRGSFVPELLERNYKDYRQITEPPWRIIYKVNGKTVNILAVIDSRRKVIDVLLQRFLTPEF